VQSFITFTQLKTCVCVCVCVCVYLHFSPPQHGNPSGTDHSKPMIQFCSFTGQHSFCHNPDSFNYPCIKISSVSHTCSEHIILHIPNTRKPVIIVECMGQETGPYLIFTWWVVGLQCDFKWRKWRKKNEICEKRRVHFLSQRPTSAISMS